MAYRRCFLKKMLVLVLALSVLPMLGGLKGSLFAQVIKTEVASGVVVVQAHIPTLFWSVVRTMATDFQGRLWIGSFGAGTWMVEQGRQPMPVLGKNGQMPSRRVSKLVVEKDRVWQATAGDGVMYYDQVQQDWVPLTPDPGKDMRFLHALWVDPTGEMFIGSVGTGAAHLKEGIWKPVGQKEGLICGWINDAIRTEKGIWCCGTDGVFLYRDGTIVKGLYPECPGATEGYWGDPSVNVLLASGETLILGTGMNGVVVIDPDGTQNRVPETKKDIQGMVFWKGLLWALGPGGFWKIAFPDKTLKGQMVSGPWEKNCPFKSITVTTGERLLAGTTDGRIYESTDGQEFRLFIKFENGKFILE